MNKLALSLVAICVSWTFVNAQTIDTLSICSCSYGVKAENGNVTYNINSESVTEEEYSEFIVLIEAKKKCAPCFLRNLDSDGNLLSEGLYYGNCPQKMSSEKVKIEMDGWNISKSYHSNDCIDGHWKYYKLDGTVKSKQYFIKGKKVSKRKYRKSLSKAK
jgi:hypothetical protein